MKIDLLYVDAFQDRHDKWRYYFRRRGHRVTLPGEPGSPQFMAAYNAALETSKAPGAAIKPKAKAGTLDALRELYFSSAEFSNLAPSTQRETRYVIEAICRAPNTGIPGTRGDNPAKALEARHILGWRDQIKSKPGAANKMVRVVKAWLSFGASRGEIPKNPALGIKMMKLGSFRDWTDDELAAFEDRWPVGTLERTGYALALYTAQRRTDLVRMRWADVSGEWLRVTQSKTGETMDVPMHAELAEALAAWRKAVKGDSIISTAKGKPLNPIYFGHRMADAIAKAGLPDGCVLHGLRKAAARILEELGHKPRGLTGHVTAHMEAEYSKRADQKRNAKAAVLDWEKAVRKRRKKDQKNVS